MSILDRLLSQFERTEQYPHIQMQEFGRTNDALAQDSDEEDQHEMLREEDDGDCDHQILTENFAEAFPGLHEGVDRDNTPSQSTSLFIGIPQDSQSSESESDSSPDNEEFTDEEESSDSARLVSPVHASTPDPVPASYRDYNLWLPIACLVYCAAVIYYVIAPGILAVCSVACLQVASYVNFAYVRLRDEPKLLISIGSVSLGAVGFTYALYILIRLLLVPLYWTVYVLGYIAHTDFTGFWLEMTLLSGLVGYCLYPQVRDWIRQQTLIHSEKYDNSGFRAHFRKDPMPDARQHRANPHGVSAGLRAVAEDFVDRLAANTLRNVYAVQDSVADRRKQLPGYREIYWETDAVLGVREDARPARPILKYTDVDYYTNPITYAPRGEYLADSSDPIVLYTFVPQYFTGGTTDYEYELNEGIVKMRLAGGGEYKHPLWDYTPDVATEVFYPFIVLGFLRLRVTLKVLCTVLGVLWLGSLVEWYLVLLIPGILYWAYLNPPEVRHYYVEKRLVGPDRFLVALIPRWSSVCWSWLYITPNALKRFETKAENGVQRRVYSREGRPRVGLRLSEIAGSVDVDLEFLNKCVLTCSSAPKTWCAQSVLRLRGDNRAWLVGPEELLAAIVAKIPSTACDAPWYDAGAYKGLPHFTNVVPGALSPEKPSMRAYMKPVWSGVAAPTRSMANEHGTIDGRIHIPRNAHGKNNGEFRPVPIKYRPYVTEYAHMLLQGKVGLLVPLNEQEVEDSQKRANQRNLAANERPLLHTAPIRPGQTSFQKAEPSNKIGAARNITNVNTNNRLRYTAFTLPVAQILKEAHWYGFGKHPQDLGKLMHKKFAKCKVLWDSDYSKFDGSIPALLRAIEQAIIQAGYPPKYHQELADLQDSLVYTPCSTGHGVKYWIWSDRPSGGSDTSVGNSICNSFTTYVAFRESGMSPQEAWDALGLYAGDDGGTGDLPEAAFMEVVKEFGLSVKLAKHTANHDPCFPFLGRVYPHIWSGPGSHIDIPRCVGKLHTTTSMDNTPDAAIAYRKAASLFITDSCTPILSNWARKVLQLTPVGLITDTDDSTMSYVSREALRDAGLVDVELQSAKLIEEYENAPLYPPSEAIGIYIDGLPAEFKQNLEHWATHIEASETLEQLLSYEDPTLRTPPEVHSVVHGDGPSYVVPGRDVVVHSPEAPPPASNKVQFVEERQTLLTDITAAQKAPPAPLPCPQFNGKNGCVEPCPKGKLHVKVCHDFKEHKCARKTCKFAHVVCPYPTCKLNRCMFQHAKPPAAPGPQSGNPAPVVLGPPLPSSPEAGPSNYSESGEKTPASSPPKPPSEKKAGKEALPAVPGSPPRRPARAPPRGPPPRKTGARRK